MNIPEVLLLLFAFIWGACWGSFGSTLIHRTMHGLSLLYPPFSVCPTCGVKIKPIQNIPVISYLMLRGKCSRCNSRIPALFLASELSSGLLGLFCAIMSHSVRDFLGMFFFYWGLLTAAISDLKFLSIPTMTLGFSLLGSLINMITWTKNLQSSVLGAVFGAGILFLAKLIYKLIKRREGLGEGDVLFMIPVGLYFGLTGTIAVIVISSMLGGVIGMIVTVRSGSREIPFIPFLFIASTFITIAVGTFYDFLPQSIPGL